MARKKRTPPPDGKDLLRDILDQKAQRKHRSRQRPRLSWLGFGMLGLIGWLVALPALLGAGLGLWLDEHFPREQSQTLALLVAGLLLGCFNAWRWLEKERQKLQDQGDEDDE